MKKIVSLISVCLAFCLAVNSCDKLLGFGGEPTIKEDGNTLILTYYYDGMSTCENIATFDDADLCIKYIEKETFKKKSDCDEEWEYGPSSNPKYTREGNTIIYDNTDEFKGKTKQEIRAYFEKWLEDEE